MNLRKHIVSSELPNASFSRREYFLRDEDDLLAYVKVHIPKSSPEVAYVIDTTSAKSFHLLSPSLQALYTQNGYNPSREVPSRMGMKCLEEALLDISGLSERIRIAVLMTRERNRRIFEQMIFSHFKNPPEFIEKLSGGGESSVATIILR